MGIMCQNLENKHLRRALGMRPEATGVMINTIQPTSNAAKVGVQGGRSRQAGLPEGPGVPLTQLGRSCREPLHRASTIHPSTLSGHPQGRRAARV